MRSSRDHRAVYNKTKPKPVWTCYRDHRNWLILLKYMYTVCVVLVCHQWSPDTSYTSVFKSFLSVVTTDQTKTSINARNQPNYLPTRNQPNYLPTLTRNPLMYVPHETRINTLTSLWYTQYATYCDTNMNTKCITLQYITVLRTIML